MATSAPVTLDTQIAVKVHLQGYTRKFKIPLRDLGANVLPARLRSLLEIPTDAEVVFERYSDSAGAYVTLEADKPQVYKTLFRAAKAKLKLRLRATIALPAGYRNGPPPGTLFAGIDMPPPSAYSAMPIAPAPLATSKQARVESAPPSPVSPIASQKPDTEGEAPVPRAFTARQPIFKPFVKPCNPDLAFRPKAVPQPPKAECSWVVFCNNCNEAMANEHFHCSICDNGDYDLCASCVDANVHCPGVGHWMVKRFVQNGAVVNSTTERVAPKPKVQPEQGMPGAFMDEKQPVVVETADEPDRTCNCCVKVLPESEFVTCLACDDYDLCMDCHVNNKHGHHPGHAFKPANPETALAAIADFLCNAGRNVRHSAVCDGCEKFIFGVRHKCLNCPDWDLCSQCIKDSKTTHPRHRFVPIYEPLAEPVTHGARHHGIFCDGPLCKDKESPSYIEGVRYKCAVCHDTDFCANCEALPTLKHNQTHPLIKFKAPVRNVSVTTLNESKNGLSMARLGDHPTRKSTATETNPVAPSTNAATQVQTILDLKPTEQAQSKVSTEKIQIRDLLAEPVQEKISVNDLLCAPVPAAPKLEPSASAALDAHFIRDTISDGTTIPSGMNFVQVWTLRNPGPNAWPAGCSVRHVGGDSMLNIDNTRALSQSELNEASESNVVGRPVEAGEEISFRIVMKAPKREGTSISYWRLKTAEGTPFGHRLWCDIQVVAPAAPASPSAGSSSVKVDAAEASLKPDPMAGHTPFARLQHYKLERLRALAAQRMQLRNLESPNNGASAGLELTEDCAEDKLRRIQQVRKAAVERLIENRRRDAELLVATSQSHSKNLEKVLENVRKFETTAELPVDAKPAEAMASSKSSTMIFPQLDKESPASSTHEALAASTQAQADASEEATLAEPSEHVHSEDEFFEDAESVEIRSISSDDEGFMTDEEYDILDASDEETA